MPPRMNPWSARYEIVNITSWKQFQDLLAGEEYRYRAFRGQADASWPLFSSLSRYFLNFGIHPRAWSEQEERSLRIFKRKAHLFHHAVPPENDSFQWLALMQHFGAPTRLLDFTWSPFVAGFFALEHATNDAAVWGVSLPHLEAIKFKFPRHRARTPVSEIGMRDPGSYERYFQCNKVPFVTYGEPNVMNQRLVAQTGTFLIPGLLHRPIDDILSAYPQPKRALTKFVLKTSQLREEAMYGFYNMNITYATLFPGLDGLARSMGYELEFNWALNPRTMKRLRA